MARPGRVLRSRPGAARRAARVLVADERVADAFTAPGDESSACMYGFSVLHCLPAGWRSDPAGRRGPRCGPTVRRCAATPGSPARVLPIEHDFWRFYRLTAVEDAEGVERDHLVPTSPEAPSSQHLDGVAGPRVSAEPHAREDRERVEDVVVPVRRVAQLRQLSWMGSPVVLERKSRWSSSSSAVRLAAACSPYS